MRANGFKCYNSKCGSCVGKTLCGEPADAALGCANRVVNAPTNADRIRDMTDEELAFALKILANNDVCLNPQSDDCDGCVFYPFCNSVRCEEDVANWLKQPYKEDT